MSPEDVDKLPEAPDDKVGTCPDGEWALIYDTQGKAWATEVLGGIRMKRRHEYAFELDRKQ